MMARPPSPSRARVLVALAALGVCAAPAAAVGAPSKEADASLPSVAAAADTEVVATIAALAACDGKGIAATCAPRDVWTKSFRAVRDADAVTDAGAVDHRRYAMGCLAASTHESYSVREVAAECVGALAAHLADRKVATRAMLRQYSVDRSGDARTAELGALSQLDPTEHGLAADVVALARPLVGRSMAKRDLRALVAALSPRSYGADIPPAPEAMAFAVDLIKRREAVGEAVRVLEQSKTPDAAACAALLDLAETKRGGWAEAIEAIGLRPGRCVEQRARAIQIVVEVAKRPSGPSQKLGLGEAKASLRSYVRSGEPSAAERALLRDAVKAATAIEGREALEDLREAIPAN